ncbi:MAG: exodeoxyribonuclease VII large subunit, partial [Weeksellaceae bacterium]|nr:exodeoxyribonuclease VII large subunit [Weeksellaceae bacterium]
ITFDTKYGLSLWIQDIDPSFTLGDLEKEKQLSIQKLKQEGIFNSNKSLKLPLLPQRIAVISVETSKGYADFVKIIDHNDWNYSFFHMLFPSLLQGDKAAEQLIGQLRMIKRLRHHFDTAAIIRGGGGEVGLSCYNDYHLAREIASFPLPVLTGIGHSTNETVAEMVAHSNHITPTKLGEFLIQKFHDFSVPVLEAEKSIITQSRNILERENKSLENLVKLFRSDSVSLIEKNKSEIKNAMVKIHSNSLSILNQAKLGLKIQTEHSGKIAFRQIREEHSALMRFGQRINEKSADYIKKQQQQLSYIEKNVQNLRPENVLKRGYSISLLNGKSMTSAIDIKKGDTIETLLFEGKIVSRVETILNTKNHE